MMEPTICPHEWERVTLATLDSGTFQVADTIHGTRELWVCHKCDSLTHEPAR